MRATAKEWVDKLRGVLGGSLQGGADAAEVQSVRQVTAPYNHENGPDSASSVPYESKSYQVTALNKYVQIVPGGYYDTVLVATGNNNTSTVKLPLFVSIQSLKRDSGLYDMPSTPAAFLLAYPPIKCAPAQSNENSLELNLPLTNAPLIVWADDGINPSSTGTYPLTVTLMTRRH